MKRRRPAPYLRAHARDPADDHGALPLADTVLRDVPPASPGDVRTLALACLDDMKAEDVVDIDLAGRTSIADRMIIASGRSQRHVGSVADRIVQALKDGGHGRVRVEGTPACDWVLIDAGDVIVHVFRPEVRAFYNLEKMWGQDRPLDRAVG